VTGTDPAAPTSRGTGADVVALEQEGRLPEAIELLTHLNRRTPKPAWDRRLVRMRHDAFAAMDRTPGLAQWPPTYDDPFPDLVGGPPEVGRDELTADVLGGAIVHHGSLLVRGLLGEEAIAVLRADIDRAFEAYDAVKQGTPVEEVAPWFVPFQVSPEHPEYPQVGFFRRRWVRDGGGVLTVDSPRGLFDLTVAFEEAGIVDVIAGYLHEPPALAVDKCTLRRVPLDLAGTDWHQDGAFLGADIRTINVWLSLSHCGDGAPAQGMDLVPRRIDHILPIGTGGAQFDWSVGPEVVAQEATDHPVVQPTFHPGDALLFDDLFLHRTALEPGCTEERYALETWFFAPSSYPSTQIPLAW
jgi:hypothetical protein